MMTIEKILKKIKATSDRGVKWENRQATDSVYIAKEYTVADLVKDLEEIKLD